MALWVSFSSDEEERKSFRAKGIPVIFQDEYEEKPEIGNKSPVILKDEKPPLLPPLLPPSYNTSNMNGDNDVDEYVPPPAVVVGGREVRGKSPATPSYRKPPPYVSP
ncbi:dystroglycan-like [Drosophila miranda]|uniref:dystroglycan-like n=1 Tax=Drosophila miranda TaxID=7229 RepID=UPI00143F0D3A|nr:dystroglycan-like [Drosophila miranda]